MKSLLIWLAAALSGLFGSAHVYLQPATSTVTVLIGGDIMLDRHNRTIGDERGYDSLFVGVSRLFHSADIVIANLEGPITTSPSETLLPDGTTSAKLVFTFATSTAEALAHAGLTAVSLANNHADNFGRDGVEQSRVWLSSAGVQ